MFSNKGEVNKDKIEGIFQEKTALDKMGLPRDFAETISKGLKTASCLMDPNPDSNTKIKGCGNSYNLSPIRAITLLPVNPAAMTFYRGYNSDVSEGRVILKQIFTKDKTEKGNKFAPFIKWTDGIHPKPYPGFINNDEYQYVKIPTDNLDPESGILGVKKVGEDDSKAIPVIADLDPHAIIFERSAFKEEMITADSINNKDRIKHNALNLMSETLTNPSEQKSFKDFLQRDMGNISPVEAIVLYSLNFQMFRKRLDNFYEMPFVPMSHGCTSGYLPESSVKDDVYLPIIGITDNRVRLNKKLNKKPVESLGEFPAIMQNTGIGVITADGQYFFIEGKVNVLAFYAIMQKNDMARINPIWNKQIELAWQELLPTIELLKRSELLTAIMQPVMSFNHYKPVSNKVLQPEPLFKPWERQRDFYPKNLQLAAPPTLMPTKKPNFSKYDPLNKYKHHPLFNSRRLLGAEEELQALQLIDDKTQTSNAGTNTPILFGWFKKPLAQLSDYTTSCVESTLSFFGQKLKNTLSNSPSYFPNIESEVVNDWQPGGPLVLHQFRNAHTAGTLLSISGAQPHNLNASVLKIGF